ncbi:hypothetical protein [Endozoicomonas sp. SCSIO W0465]|uniref:hypothetical protein n=1 Tax=Endozoicomonas sp. SCSIO W0465 TaxID=2918516 RepID=UPI002075D099|nr:hypothetical protein [Endozoicomonas sp. SCSIO W0465]USE35940.1 hypothetical protein MJO57_28410 [Endozoicomonas sp. SCSIO W0465]
MNSSNAIVDRFASFSDYLYSSEFKKNPKANVFSPLRKVSSQPADNNYLPLLYELKVEVIKYLNFKEFFAFSSINVDNYLSIRSDDLLVERVIKKEVRSRILLRLEDLQQKAQQYPFDLDDEIETNFFQNAVVPSIAYSPGPSKLVFNMVPEMNNKHSFEFVNLFRHLCKLAMDDSINRFSRALICSLTIDINNRMTLKECRKGTLFALSFIGIASHINQLSSIEDKDIKLSRLANMIEDEKIDIKKLHQANIYNKVLALSEKKEFYWYTFIDSLHA